MALAIVALSLTAAMASVSQQIRAAEAIQERTYASWVGQNKIAELRLSSETPEVGDDDDEVRFADLDWDLNTNILETGVEGLYRIDVEVGFAGRDEVIRTVTGFIGEPGIPGQANLAWTRGAQFGSPEEEEGEEGEER